ncbi:carboxylate-amine ligase [Paractinoplanes toevensis]|uniref:Uncharacterized protein n=1 Tax=Paractinoplanes toevensis TaxID=571911 RepID=A0A919TGN7_9ACTN|nr:glutamate-cysteine ligase family protein [Actinoplanes toevensis]GIM93626.1 hypothetical protein Ato02nite_054190 [Actinoplanes toevensis]
MVALGTVPLGPPLPALRGLRLEAAVPDRQLAVRIFHCLRTWLPVIHAMTANSPFDRSVDTGYASWCFVQQQRETLGMLAPRLWSVADHEHTADRVRQVTATVSRAVPGWTVRPHPRDSGVQVRAGDVCLGVDDSVLVAALVRAAVVAATQDLEAGRSNPPVDLDLVYRAHWQAARQGLTGTLIDVRLGRERPAWELVHEFFATVTPGLPGDVETALTYLAEHSIKG